MAFELRAVGIQAAKELLFSLQKNPSLEGDLVDAADGTSLLGTLVYDELVIGSGNFFESTDINQESPVPYEGLKLHTVIIEVTMTKNIVTTSLQGRDGTVKEYISKGDFVINIFGKIIGENDGDLESDPENATIRDIGNFYPTVDVTRLKTILEVADSIKLTSDFLNIFDIQDCVVTNYSIPQKEATRNEQPFKISLLSDSLIELNELEVPS